MKERDLQTRPQLENSRSTKLEFELSLQYWQSRSSVLPRVMLKALVSGETSEIGADSALGELAAATGRGWLADAIGERPR